MIYFDHNASSPLNEEVLQTMLPYLQSVQANPSSLHRSGRLARSAIESARYQLAETINCQPDQVIFTSGGTESNNMVFNGVQANDLLVGSVEHASVIEPARLLAKQSELALSFIPVDEQGVYQLSKLDRHFNGLVSMQWVNNETGVVQPVEDLKNQCADALLHIDASQALGKIAVDFAAVNADFMTLSAHKFNGPKGCGALIVKNPDSFLSGQVGGFQEQAKRAGTENTAAIVGMAKAAEIAVENLDQRIRHTLEVRDYFEQQLLSVKGMTIFSHSVPRVSNTSFFALPFFHGETFLMECDKAGFELASGSACHSQITEQSHVLQAMNIPEPIGLNAIRLSVGENNSRQQIDEFIQFIHDKLENLPAAIKSAVGFN